jgi:AcrR family transcriptional regulator
MPRNTLTADQIVRAAIDLLDAEGLDGLNMRSLGQRLGSAATAVYWHVENKDNLVRLAADRVWQEVPLPDLDQLAEVGGLDERTGRDRRAGAEPAWRTAATELATGLHAMMTRHPWLVQALAGHLLYGPGKSRYDEHTLAVYEQAGFVGAEADQAAAAVFMFVLGATVPAAATVSLTRRLRADGADPDQRLREVVAEASAVAQDFPRLRARLEDTSANYNASPDNSFEVGLNALLDGLQQRLRKEAAPQRS